jgi:hypothetical protein
VVCRASFVVPDEDALERLQVTAGVESWGAPIVWRAPEPMRRSVRPPRPGASEGEAQADAEATLLRVEGAPAKQDLTASGTLLMGGASGVRSTRR